MSDRIQTEKQPKAKAPNGTKTVKVPRHKLPVSDPNYESLAMKFKRLANKRVPRAIKAIGHIRNMANRAGYDYTQEQANKIINALHDAVDDMQRAFEGTKQSTSQWSL